MNEKLDNFNKENILTNELFIDLFKNSLPGGLLGGYLEEQFSFYIINEKMLEYTGYSSQNEFVEDIKGCLLNCIHPQDRDRVINEVSEQYLSGKKELISNYRFIKKDKNYIWISALGKVFKTKDGKDVIISTFIDITHQKELENQLDLYRLASQGGAFVVKLTEGNPLVYGNDIYFNIIGYTPDMLKEKFDNNCDGFVHPEDVSLLHKIIEKAIEKGKENVEWEMRVLTGMGNTRWIQVRGTFEFRNGIRHMNGFIMDVNEKYQFMEQIRKSEERYRIALKEVDIIVWDYDIDSKVLLRTQGSPQYEFFPEVMNNAPESVIASGFIHPNSIKDYLNLYKQFKKGVPKIDCDIQISMPNSQISYWEHISSIVIFNDEGIPVRVVSISENITKQKEAEFNYQYELQMRESLMEGFITGNRVNLTKNIVEFVQVTNNSVKGLVEGISYDESLQIIMKSMINEDDKKRYNEMFSRKALLSSFKKDEKNIAMEYRKKNPDGNICWVSVNIRLMQDMINGDIYYYGYLKDISSKKSIELSLRQRVEKDIVTGAYNKETFLNITEDLIIKAQKNNEEYSFIIFNIDNFTKIIQQNGYQLADRIVKEIYMILESQIKEPKVIGRLFSDEIVVWINRVSYKNQISSIVDNIKNISKNNIYLCEVDLQISVGMAYCEDGLLTQNELINRALEALFQGIETGGNQLISYNDITKQHKIKQEEFYNCNDVEQLINDCAEILNSNQNFERVVTIVLKKIGKYYGADRAYLIELEHINNGVKKIYDWQNDEFINNYDCESNIFTNWIDIMDENDFIFIENIKNDPDIENKLGQVISTTNLRGFYVAKLVQYKNTCGYLVVNNPIKNCDNKILLKCLRHFIAKEMQSHVIWENQEYIRNYDELTKILNRYSYLMYISKINPETFISMGAVVIDINGLKKLNTTYGYDYGDKIIVFTANAMKQYLINWNIFRIAGDEFLGICENLTITAFQQQIKDLTTQIDEGYPQGISIGCAWTDTDINVENLIAQADEKMIIAKQIYYKGINVISKRHDPKEELKLINEIHQGQYEMYLQPKASISGDSIVGAEALVRYKDKNKNLVSPDKFIPQLEQSGNIYYIDIFIFEEVCKTIKCWIDKGISVIPISLNFSRITLLTENLVNHMEDIYKKYKFPKKFIEIEVTESVGSIERQTLVEICTQITEHDYHLALDDFGARYSNLSILSAMKLHVLKLDKSLVNDLFSNPNTRIIVKSFLSACKDLNVSSVAEGVETKEQLETLQMLGCDYAQGYYFNKPLPRSDFERLYLS